MADLNVQPKRKSLFWLWVLIIFIVGLLLFFFLNRDNQETTDRAPAPDTLTTDGTLTQPDTL